MTCIVLTIRLLSSMVFLLSQDMLKDRVWLRRLYHPRRWTHYLITRNRYDRLVSFYEIKLNVISHKSLETHGWQRCQTLLF